MTRGRNPPGTAVDCKSCGAPMVWAISEKGKPIPCDVKPAEKGSLFLFRRPDKIEAIYYLSKHPSAVRARARGQAKHLAHWATCPRAEQYRRKDSR